MCAKLCLHTNSHTKLRDPRNKETCQIHIVSGVFYLLSGYQESKVINPNKEAVSVGIKPSRPPAPEGSLVVGTGHVNDENESPGTCTCMNFEYGCICSV